LLSVLGVFLIAAAGIGPAVGALIGAGGQADRRNAPLAAPRALAVGVLVIAPLLISVTSPPVR
jgi:hypothetical protein